MEKPLSKWWVILPGLMVIYGICGLYAPPENREPLGCLLLGFLLWFVGGLLGGEVIR